MRLFLTALMIGLAVPAMAQDRQANIAATITKTLNDNGPLGYIGLRCSNLNGVPVWGGVRGTGDQPRELTGSGVKLNCGTNGLVERGELKAGFQGPLPQATTFQMRQKDVWKHLRKRGLKKEITKGKTENGRFVRLNRRTAVTWRWDDKRGRQPVSVILLNQ